jgi:hypothetical protein
MRSKPGVDEQPLAKPLGLDRWQIAQLFVSAAYRRERLCTAIASEIGTPYASSPRNNAVRIRGHLGGRDREIGVLIAVARCPDLTSACRSMAWDQLEVGERYAACSHHLIQGDFIEDYLIMKGMRTWTAFTFVAAISFSSHIAAQDRLNYPAAGITVDRPTGWQEATLEQIQANRERTRLSDPELQRALATRSAMPIVAFMKYSEPHSGLNPAVQITLRPTLAGTPSQLLTVALEPMQRAVQDFRLITPVQATEVDGWPAAHARVAYTLQNAAGQRFAVLSRLWVVPRGRLLFLIGMSGSPAGSDLCEDDFAAVLASIDIQH